MGNGYALRHKLEQRMPVAVTSIRAYLHAAWASVQTMRSAEMTDLIILLTMTYKVALWCGYFFIIFPRSGTRPAAPDLTA